MSSPQNFQATAGHGIAAQIDGRGVLIGNAKWMRENQVTPDEIAVARLSEQAKTPVFIGLNGKYAGIIAVADPIKKSSHEAIEQLCQLGLEAVMLTGDNTKKGGSNCI